MSSSIPTVVIPFYNSITTLPDAVRSVLAQTHKDWKLILIDDGSTDGSTDFAMSLEDSRIHVVSDGVNLGLPFRLNQAASIARGEYVFRMDADDIMHPHRLERQLDVLISDPSIQLVCSPAVSIDDRNRILGVRAEGQLAASPGEVLRRGGFLTHPTLAGRRRWFLENPYSCDYPRSEDFELWIRSNATSVTKGLREPLLFYREGFSGVRSYARSCKTGRRLFEERGPALVGRWQTQRLLVRSFSKQMIYLLAHWLGAESFVLRRRYRACSQEEATIYRSILNGILSVELPIGNRRDLPGRKGQPVAAA